MIVSIQGVNVTTSDGDKPYKIAEVSYNKDGKDEVRKVVSFGDSIPAFKSLVALKAFPANVDVKLKQNGKYWNWIDVSPVGEGAVAAAANDTPARKGNYETTEERARRQVYIVRQSSVTNAIETLKARGDKFGASDAIEMAKQYEAYVFEQPEPVVK